MWVRMMYFYDVGFVPEPLSAFRFHSASTGFTNIRQNRNWMDMIWLMEGLLGHEEIRTLHPQIKRLRYVEARRIVKQQIERIRGRNPMPVLYMLRSIVEYFIYRLQSLIRSAPSIHR